MKKYSKNIVLFLLLLLAFSGCSDYQKLLKSDDSELKYTKAVEYYEENDYSRALELFEQLVTIYRVGERAQKINYYMAYCYYNSGNYIIAGYYFRNFAKTYPRHKNAEECFYLSAYCYYLDSPSFELDQANTNRAIEELQLFITRFPYSEKIEKCNRLIDELRNKLALKAFKSAMLYHNLSDYKAAIMAFKACLNDFPDTRYRQEIQYHIVKANYLLAINSIEKKEQERLKNTLKVLNQFVKQYPQSQYQKELDKIKKEVTKQLNN